MKIYGNEIELNDLKKRIGDTSQLGGIKFYEYSDGLSKGIRAIDIKCPSGIDITVLVDRGMDISNCFFKNIPICWRSVTRETSPFYHDNRRDEWLRGFFGGLLTTCGLENTGRACNIGDEEFGLHGRISNITAESINTFSAWENNDYRITLEGKLRQVKVFGDKLVLTRKITTFFLNPTLVIEDSVENIGFQISPLMILYHINIGYPLIDKNSRFIEGRAKITGVDINSKKEIDSYDIFSEPIMNYKERAYYHEIEPDKSGDSNIAIINEEFNKGIGIGFWLRYNTKNLPFLLQWKQMGEGEYVCGIEPANCLTRGREVEEKNNTLKFIKPGEIINYRLEIKILSGKKEIKDLKDKLKINDI